MAIAFCGLGILFPRPEEVTDMARLPKFILPHQTYFVTTNVLNREWVFVERSMKDLVPGRCDIVCKNLEFYRSKYQFGLFGYVIMPDHVHLLLQVSPRGTIRDVMRDWKRWTACELNKLLNRRGSLWQSDFYEHSIRNEVELAVKLNYIHENPVRAGFVERPEDWRYSSARWYAGLPSVLRIDALAG